MVPSFHFGNYTILTYELYERYPFDIHINFSLFIKLINIVVIKMILCPWIFHQYGMIYM